MPNIPNSSNNQIHIALGFDENYIVHVYALLTSIFLNNRSNKIILHAIATGIGSTEKQKFHDFTIANNSQIYFYSISNDDLGKHLYTDDVYSIATYYRLFFPSLIDPGIAKLIYLDSDTIVNGDLKTLYCIDIGSYPLAAAPDACLDVRPELGIYRSEDYFNAGVMLIDTKNWREQNVSENAIKYLVDYPERIRLVDQDALNATLIDRWFRIDKKYNFTWLGEYLWTPTKELLADVVIVHYITPKKPWHFLTRNKFRYLYHYYLKKSPKAHEKKYTDFKWSIKDIYVFIRIRVKEFYFDQRINKILPIKRWMKPHSQY